MAKSSGPTFEVVHDQTGERAEVTYEEYVTDFRPRGFHATAAGAKTLAVCEMQAKAASPDQTVAGPVYSPW